MGPKNVHAKIVDTAMKTNQYYTLQWKMGTLTNSERALAKGNASGHTPLPDLLVVLNVKDNMQAIREATLMNIPVIGVVDTDADAGSVIYPVYCNDDSMEALTLVLGVIQRAVLDGLENVKSE